MAGAVMNKDEIVMKRLCDWMIKVGGIVPSRAATYAGQLVYEGGIGSLARLGKRIVKLGQDDGVEFLLELGMDEEDAEEVVEAILSQDESNRQGDRGFFSRMNSAVSTTDDMSGYHLSSSPSNISMRKMMKSQNSMASVHSAVSGMAGIIPPAPLSGHTSPSPERSYREARLVRLEAQAQRAATLAASAEKEAEQLKNVTKDKKVIAASREKAYAAQSQARDAAFLTLTEDTLASNTM